MTALTLTTERLVLAVPQERHFAAFAAMHRDRQVMHDYPALLSEAESRAKWDRYLRVWDQCGHGRWLIESRSDGSFIGYVGIQPMPLEYGVAADLEIGWRMVRAAWSNGYATEGARAVLRDGFQRCGMAEVVATTSASNARSQAVMRRLGMERASHLDNGPPERGTAIVYRMAAPGPGG